MRFAGNTIWFILGGAIISLYWLIGAAIFALSIIGLPLTRAAIEMAKMSAFPFGKDVVHIRELDGKDLSKTSAATGTIGFIANFIWLNHLWVDIIFALYFCRDIKLPYSDRHSLWPTGF